MLYNWAGNKLAKAKMPELAPGFKMQVWGQHSNRSLIRLALLANVFLILSFYNNTVDAQNQSYSSAPAASTQNAINPPTGVDDELLPGFYPSISIVASRHSNSLQSSGLEQADTVITVTPAFVFKTELGVGRHSAQISYTPVIEKYDKLSSEDEITHNLDGSVHLDVSDKFSVDLNAGYSDGAESRGASGTPLEQSLDRNEFNSTRYGAQAIYGRRSAKMQVAGAVSRNELRFTNNDQELRNRDSDNLTGRIYYNIGPKTATFLEGSVTDIDYLSGISTLDSTETRYSLGLRWDTTAITGAEIKVGHLEKDFDDPSGADFSGLSYLGSINWQPRPFTSAKFYASRTTEESTTDTASYFASNLFGVSASHDLTGQISVFGYLNFTNDEFSDGREDDITDVGIGIDYLMRPWLKFGAQYGLVERDSTDPVGDFEDQFISLSVTATRP